MEEIKVGEYVRTRMGTIGKFKYYGDDKENIYFKNDRGTTCVYEKEIVKHSKNVIDLIEVGDYVNGKEVIELAKYDIEVQWLDLGENIPLITDNEDIKSIITKEQIKQIEYRIKE